jgi:hypothetical protein
MTTWGCTGGRTRHPYSVSKPVILRDMMDGVVGAWRLKNQKSAIGNRQS